MKSDQRPPIETLSPDKPYWLRKWVGKQPHGSSILRDLSEDQILRWMCAALTLADWLIPYREKLLGRAKPKVALIGASADSEGVNQGQPLRYVAPLLGLTRLDFHLVGRESPTGILQPGTAEYPSQVRGSRVNWQEIEQREISEGMDAAFLFHPGLHATPRDVLPYVPKEHGNDLLETGCFKAIVLAGLPLGMSAFNLKDAKRDCEKLEAHGFKTANLRKNRWGFQDANPVLRQDTGEVLRDGDGDVLYNANSLYLWNVISLSIAGDANQPT